MRLLIEADEDGATLLDALFRRMGPALAASPLSEAQDVVVTELAKETGALPADILTLFFEEGYAALTGKTDMRDQLLADRPELLLLKGKVMLR